MSPALQGNLEVERYIGSYLISQRVPPNVKSSTSAKRYQNQHQKPKNPETEKVHRNFNKYCFPQREHHVGGPPRYSMPPPMPVDCQAYPNPYGKHNPGNSGWAGVPLISMTSGNHRRNKKVLPTTNHNHAQKYSNKQTQQNFYVKNKDIEDSSQAESDRSPLTRLAIHTQGAPLIQAGRFGNNNRCRNNFNRDQPTRVFRNEGVRWDGAKDTKTPVVVPNNKEQACGTTDSSSVASDESSGNSENSLPRIIKPRKRRKKDRKPITGTTPMTSSTSNEPSQFTRELEQSVESSALKTYLPLCYEQNKANSSENKISDILSDNSHISPSEEKQSEDLIDPLTSANEFPFGNLLDDEEDSHGEGPPATLCQCRYCDPSGVIWDVDQRCYSPFLTPPSPSDGKLHFSDSLPLTFESFGHIGRPYDRPEQPLTPPSQYSFTGDLVSLLRRSWSDPSPYKTPDSIPSPNSECCRERLGSRPSSPGLQVSSEIVTSPNGHRDIEIKFYSTSSPPDSSKMRFGASDRDQNNSDRCFVVEE